ncbi:hypothetical protein [Caproiciproducens galactitolivorans]|uniref:hypothetical protein n=1 Tax=Caproiciproducens galactitolivorans TaxID=642589 RepID=UPI00240A496B|nr:hypothetical protein [Caproiciproducens galactitolivorans]
MNKKQYSENESRNFEQMVNELRVQSYTEGYRAGYLEACRWNDVGTGSHDGPLPVNDDMDEEDPYDLEVSESLNYSDEAENMGDTPFE